MTRAPLSFHSSQTVGQGTVRFCRLCPTGLQRHGPIYVRKCSGVLGHLPVGSSAGLCCSRNFRKINHRLSTCAQMSRQNRKRRSGDGYVSEENDERLESVGGGGRGGGFCDGEDDTEELGKLRPEN